MFRFTLFRFIELKTFTSYENQNEKKINLIEWN